MGKLIGEELSANLESLGNYENFFNEGDEGELRIYNDNIVSEETLKLLEEDISSQGVVLTEPITQDVGIISIKFQKAIAPLLIIGGAVIAVVGGILGWQIFKTTQAGVPLWIWGIGGLALAYLLFTSKPAKQAGGIAIQAGKVYVTRKAVK